MRRRFFTSTEMAAYLGVHRGTLMRWRREGRITGEQWGKGYKYDRKNVLRELREKSDGRSEN